MVFRILANSIKCFGNRSPKEYELLDCTRKCEENECDSCAVIESSMGIDYACHSSLSPLSQTLSLSKDECKVVSAELNEKFKTEKIKALEAIIEMFPQLAEQNQEAIEELKNLEIKKVCVCENDGCNDPGKNFLKNSNYFVKGNLAVVLTAICMLFLSNF